MLLNLFQTFNSNGIYNENHFTPGLVQFKKFRDERIKIKRRKCLEIHKIQMERKLFTPTGNFGYSRFLPC